MTPTQAGLGSQRRMYVKKSELRDQNITILGYEGPTTGAYGDYITLRIRNDFDFMNEDTDETPEEIYLSVSLNESTKNSPSSMVMQYFNSTMHDEPLECKLTLLPLGEGKTGWRLVDPDR